MSDLRHILVTVIGGGFVGLPLAAHIAGNVGARVTVVDVRDREAVIARVHERDLPETIARAGDRLQFVRAGTVEAKAAMGMASMTVICVPTPSGEDGSCSIDLVRQAAKAWQEAGACGVLAIKSTVPPGTTRMIVEQLIRDDDGVDAGYTQRVVFWPEFMAEGTAMADLRNPVRTLVGFVNSSTGTLPPSVATLFGRLATHNFAFVDSTTAEGVKYASNVMLAARLTVANEVARIVAGFGGDGREAVRLAGQDPRIGSQYLRPEAGWGGSCFPKDVIALAYAGRSPLLRQILGTNDFHVAWTERSLDVAVAHVRFLRRGGWDADVIGGNVDDVVRVVVLGTSFKAGTNDSRTAPHMQAVLGRKPDPAIEFQIEADPTEPWATGLDAADVIIIGTDEPEFVDADAWMARMSDGSFVNKVIMDGRGAMSPSLYRLAQFMVFGRPTPEPDRRS